MPLTRWKYVYLQIVIVSKKVIVMSQTKETLTFITSGIHSQATACQDKKSLGYVEDKQLEIVEYS